MKNPTNRNLRNAVLLTALITMIIMLALLDPSCRPHDDPHRTGLPHSVNPN
ncbi:MAG: hypothetical protein WC378_12670 [Opitutaceae bacterium]|jgi:hypothetical protein